MSENSGSRRYCGNCGAEIRASNRFCVSCGASNGPPMLDIDKEQFSNYVRVASSFISRSTFWVKETGKRQPRLTAIVSIIGIVVLLSVAKTVAYLPLIGGFLSFLGYLAMVPFFLALIPPAIEWRKKQVQQNEERKRQAAQRAEEERRRMSEKKHGLHGRKAKYDRSDKMKFKEPGIVYHFSDPRIPMYDEYGRRKLGIDSNGCTVYEDISPDELYYRRVAEEEERRKSEFKVQMDMLDQRSSDSLDVMVYVGIGTIVGPLLVLLLIMAS